MKLLDFYRFLQIEKCEKVDLNLIKFWFFREAEKELYRSWERRKKRKTFIYGIQQQNNITSSSLAVRAHPLTTKLTTKDIQFNVAMCIIPENIKLFDVQLRFWRENIYKLQIWYHFLTKRNSLITRFHRKNITPNEHT